MRQDGRKKTPPETLACHPRAWLPREGSRNPGFLARQTKQTRGNDGSGFAGLLALVALIALLASASAAHAQYNPIPNYSGANAGQQFRGAVNDRFSGVQPTSPKIVSLTFANLPAEQDGFLIYCKDCQKTIPCAGGGSGAWAFGQRGAWACTAPGSLEQDLNANSHKVTNLAADTTTGDALSRGQSTASSLATGGSLNVTGLTAGPGSVSIIGAQTNGADQMSHVNVGNNIDATTYGVKCDGLTDNTTAGQNAINAVCSAKGTLTFPIGTCLYDHWTVPTCDGAIIQGSGTKTVGATTTVLKATSTTQGACTTAGTTGGIQSLNSGFLTLQHFYLTSSPGALLGSCLLSIVGTTSDTHVNLRDVAVYSGATPAAGTDPIDVYSSHLTHFKWDDVVLGGNASYLWYMGGYSNGGEVDSMLLEGRPIYDIGNFGIVASGNGVNFIGLDSEFQLNALLDNAAGSLVNFKYTGDPPINCGVWKPGMTMTAPSNWAAQNTTASCVEPVIAGTSNAVITGTCTASSTTISNVTNATPATLWVGLPVHLAGCGASGADLSTRIASVSGSTIAVDTAPSTSVSNAALLIPAYAGHLYIASTAGASSTTTVPTFPTSAGGTVTDNTGVWTEIGPGAQVQAESYATIIASDFGAGSVYVYAPYNSAGGPQILGNVMTAPTIAGVVNYSGGKIVAAAASGNNDSVVYWLGDGTHTVDFDFDLANVVTGVINVNVTDVAYFAPNSRGLFKYNGVWSGGHVADDSGNGGASLWSYFWNGNFYPASIRGAWGYVTGAGASATSGFVNGTNAQQLLAARNAANTADIQVAATDSSNNVVLGGTNAAGIATVNPLKPNGSVTTLAGTSAGNVYWSQPFQGSGFKKALLNFQGYENTTSTAQTITFPTAFTYAPSSNGSCPTGISLSTTTATLPASMGSPFTGQCVVQGQ